MTESYENLHNWFARTTGKWVSERRYIFNMETLKPTNLTTTFTIGAATDGQNDYVVTWDGQTQGTMNLTLSGRELHRDIGYYTSEPTVSLLSMVDDDTLVMITTYDGMTFREEIRMLYNDTVRLRQTIGRALEDNSVRIVGQYYETREF